MYLVAASQSTNCILFVVFADQLDALIASASA